MFRIILTLLLLFSVSCSKNDIDRADNTPNKGEQNDNNGNDNNDDNTGSNENNPGDENDKPIEWGDERSYVFDLSSLPEVRMTISMMH